jgi:UDP-GlcNAc:undecaprenyl-phosphate GlcNAc-1-phosphate transferase
VHIFAGRGRRVLIYGAGDSGELLLRELQNNSHWPYEPVGFLDDDPLKKDRLLHGLPVFGGNGSMPAICRQHDVQEVFISSSKFTPERVQEILEDCRRMGIVLRRLQIRLDPLTETRHQQPLPLATEVVYE